MMAARQNGGWASVGDGLTVCKGAIGRCGTSPN